MNAISEVKNSGREYSPPRKGRPPEMETKNILTREEQQGKLLAYAKKKLLLTVGLLAAALILCIPLACLAVSLAASNPVLCAVLSLPFAVLPVIFLCRAVLDGLAVGRVSRGDFAIVKDTVSRREEYERVYFRWRRYENESAVYFGKYGRYRTHGTVFDLATVGAEFYLVLLPGRKEEIAFAYPAEGYVCSELSYD